MSMKKLSNFLEIFHNSFGSCTLHFGLKYEIIYQLDAIECLFVFFQLDMFRAYVLTSMEYIKLDHLPRKV